ncbi:MAG: hypothetical protein U5K53_00705 [Halanaerobiales bacterium]|nr:hypothetical protein [Halanaerobiales bacterium]
MSEEKNLKKIVDDFKEDMYETTETGEELESKIKEKNNSLIKNIIDYFMDLFIFSKKSN